MKTSLVAIAISVPCAFLLGSLSLPLSPLCYHPHRTASRNLPFLSKPFSCPYCWRCGFFPQSPQLSTPSPLEDNIQLCLVSLDLPICNTCADMFFPSHVVFRASLVFVKRQQTSIAFIAFFCQLLPLSKIQIFLSDTSSAGYVLHPLPDCETSVLTLSPVLPLVCLPASVQLSSSTKYPAIVSHLF